MSDHNELITKLNTAYIMRDVGDIHNMHRALRAVVELHKPIFHPDIKGIERCSSMCDVAGQYVNYPCPTIQAIEKELK